jgi:hypothetical protein
MDLRESQFGDIAPGHSRERRKSVKTDSGHYGRNPFYEQERRVSHPLNPIQRHP